LLRFSAARNIALTRIFSTLFITATVWANASQMDHASHGAMMQEKHGTGTNEKKYQQQHRYRNGSGEGQGQGKQMRKRNGSGEGMGRHGKR